MRFYIFNNLCSQTLTHHLVKFITLSLLLPHPTIYYCFIWKLNVNINSPFGKIYYSFITPLSPQNLLPFYLKVQTLTWFITLLILPLPLITLLLPSPLLNKTGRLHTKFTLVGYNKRAIIESTPKVHYQTIFQHI